MADAGPIVGGSSAGCAYQLQRRFAKRKNKRRVKSIISSAIAKCLPTDSGSEIVNQALQLFGGYGYLRDYPIERFWRDLRVHSILEGTNQVMRMIIGRDPLRL